MTTYNRKYYLIRKLKADGWKLLLKDGQRTIVIPSDKIKEADDNQIIWELMNKFGFGAQIKKNLLTPFIIGNEPLVNIISGNNSARENKAVGDQPLSNNELAFRTDGKERFPGRKLPLFKRILNKLYAR